MSSPSAPKKAKISSGTTQSSYTQDVRASIQPQDDGDGPLLDPFSSPEDSSGFITALGTYSACSELPRTLLELNLIAVSGAIRDRSEWWNKIQHSNITNNWMQEAAQQGIGSAEFEFALTEARSLQEQYAACVAKPAPAEGTFMCDGLPNGLQDRLVRDITRLREEFNPVGTGFTMDLVPRPKTVDVHPGSDGMVIDLVHPGLYAYEQSVSAVMPQAGAEMFSGPVWEQVIGTSDVAFEPSKQPSVKAPPTNHWGRSRTLQNSRPSPGGLLWLPSEFMMSEGGTECSINSYINNLHPKQHASLYKGVARCFAEVAAPLFESVLSQLGTSETAVVPWPLRVQVSLEDDEYGRESWWVYPNGRFGAGDCPTEYDEEFQSKDEEDWDDAQERLHCAREEWMSKTNEGRVLLRPHLPSTFTPPPMPVRKISLHGRSLQVITKIASIELTPSTPRYEGGTWHVEGMRDEHIVATTCIYLESENVGETRLEFRTQIKEPLSSNGYSQKLKAGEWRVEDGDDEGNELIYGFGGSGAKQLVQPRGTSRTLSGRSLAWPNTLQHRVMPFELEDKKLPGRRTILCFFLIDPKHRVRSTATVPPQSREWVQLTVRGILLQITPRLPLVIRSQVASYIGDEWMTYEEASDRRLRLMEERKAAENDVQGKVGRFYVPSVSFCEH